MKRLAYCIVAIVSIDEGMVLIIISEVYSNVLERDVTLHLH